MFMSTSSSALAYFRLFMSTLSSCQPVSKVDMLLKVHIYVLVNLKFSISFISAYSCQPQVHVNIRLMLSCICISTPHMHVHTKLACNEDVCQLPRSIVFTSSSLALYLLVMSLSTSLRLFNIIWLRLLIRSFVSVLSCVICSYKLSPICRYSVSQNFSVKLLNCSEEIFIHWY